MSASDFSQLTKMVEPLILQTESMENAISSVLPMMKQVVEIKQFAVFYFDGPFNNPVKINWFTFLVIWDKRKQESFW